MASRTPKKSSRILQDHKREGKTFLPPWRQMNLKSVSWTSAILPEFLWIGLILNRYGLKVGVHSIEAFVNVLRSLPRFEKKKYPFAFMSSFGQLSDSEKELVVSELSPRLQKELEESLAPLLIHYPNNPLAFISKSSPDSVDEAATLQEFKEVLSDLTNRRDPLATKVQATAVYIANITGKMHINKGLTLSKIESIKYYPDTEESRLVASSVRASINAMMGIFPEARSDWPKRFWNRGLELEECYGFD